MRLLLAAGGILALFMLSACGPDPIDPHRQVGPNPYLPPLHQYLLPPMHVAKVVGWNGAHACGCRGPQGGGFRDGPCESALPLRASERRCPGGRDRRTPGARQPAQGIRDELDGEDGALAHQARPAHPALSSGE